MFGFNNAEPIDVGDANIRLREECQGLLLQVKNIYRESSNRMVFGDKNNSLKKFHPIRGVFMA